MSLVITNAARRRIRRALGLRNAGVVYALIALVLVMTILAKTKGAGLNYLSGINIANILDQTSLVGILAVFTTIVLISGNFDLSIGSVAALSGALCLKVLDHEGPVIAVLVALSVGIGIGALNGFLVQIVGVNAFIVTLGTLTTFRGLILTITNAQTVTASSTSLAPIADKRWNTPNLLLVAGVLALALAAAEFGRGRRHIPAKPWAAAAVVSAVAGVALLIASAFLSYAASLTLPCYYMIGVCVLAWAVLRYTVIGRRLYAVGGNAEAARLSGINVNRYKIVAFVLSGAAAGLVGMLFSAKLGAVNPSDLTGLELTVLAAAILGGTSLFGGAGSVVKSVVGALILYALADGFNLLNLGANYQGVIQGGVIIAAATTYTLSSRERAPRVRVGRGSVDDADPVVLAQPDRRSPTEHPRQGEAASWTSVKVTP